eukprot:CAMPEP_0119382034 /NCGR_PEP_ID=MMETSP1334-20130426/69051_1 /TAXON_ID=127549 /ORGANISM="Calcidiscus leptoporus, Strain RCC1130" /LENGTH=40 /DNA_ID= /DNA_START= /DNA_END= /DNA_ORIENTATION=
MTSSNSFDNLPRVTKPRSPPLAALLHTDDSLARSTKAASS